MGLFWFVTGAVSVGALMFVARSGQRYGWWQWALIVLYEAACVFGLAMAVTTYAEGNPTGGNVLLIIALGLAVVAFIGLRYALRLGVGTPKTKTAKA